MIRKRWRWQSRKRVRPPVIEGVWQAAPVTFPNLPEPDVPVPGSTALLLPNLEPWQWDHGPVILLE